MEMVLRFFEKVPVKVDGMVQGSAEYVLIEIKFLFSIILTHLGPWGSTFCHSHSINAFTIWLYGGAIELKNGQKRYLQAGSMKLTRRSDFHKISTLARGSWFLTFRGPWVDTWQEERNGKFVTLTHGRKEVQ